MKLLIASSAKDCLSAIEKALRGAHILDVTCSFSNAVGLAQNFPYDVIILTSCGFVFELSAVCGSLRAAGVETPVMIVGRSKNVRHKVYFLDHGADDYISSPFNYNELTDRLRALGRRACSVREPSGHLYVGDIKLDRSSRTLVHKGTHIPLRRKEFEIFEFLALNKGKVVTKEVLLDRVSRHGSELSPNNIEVHICSLREKLHKYCEKSCIYTVYGFGYKVSD